MQFHLFNSLDLNSFVASSLQLLDDSHCHSLLTLFLLVEFSNIIIGLPQSPSRRGNASSMLASISIDGCDVMRNPVLELLSARSLDGSDDSCACFTAESYVSGTLHNAYN